jgi:hypothetical protein
MTESEIIDHVAKAIRNCSVNIDGRGKPFETLPAHILKSWRAEAEAAIKAYRETQE